MFRPAPLSRRAGKEGRTLAAAPIRPLLPSFSPPSPVWAAGRCLCGAGGGGWSSPRAWSPGVAANSPWRCTSAYGGSTRRRETSVSGGRRRSGAIIGGGAERSGGLVAVTVRPRSGSLWDRCRLSGL
jgi:hypothetical protein